MHSIIPAMLLASLVPLFLALLQHTVSICWLICIMSFANGKMYVHYFGGIFIEFHSFQLVDDILQVPSMSYPLVAEAALLAGPKSLQKFAKYMPYVSFLFHIFFR